jgi:1-acyl-sn-glycerol-3-phosphate acyltransferase
VDDWKLEPARDLELPAMERYRSPRREAGLVESGLRLAWWGTMRAVFRTWNRLTVEGREHLPAAPPFVLVANHASHLDAMVLGALLPLAWRDRLCPLAAKDVFFERLPIAGFAALVLNALPVWRGSIRGHGLSDLRQRLIEEQSVYILFPEGQRTRSGEMNRFKAGIGMLVAGTPVPVVPCYLHGAFEAMRPKSWLLRPARITARLGKAVTFTELANERAGWDQVAERLNVAVRALMPQDKESLGGKPFGLDQ